MSVISPSPFQSAVAQPSHDLGPAPALKSFSHLSLPCRDMNEAVLFYCVEMGGDLVVEPPLFSLVSV